MVRPCDVPGKIVEASPAGYTHLKVVQRSTKAGAKRGGKGDRFSRAPNHGAPNHCGGRRKVSTKSQVLSSIQYICFRKTSDWNMGAPKFCLAPAPSNFVTPLDQGPSGVITSPTWLGPILLWRQQSCQRAENHEVFRDLLGAALPATLRRGTSGVKMNEEKLKYL